ncbi:MAG: YraN family protein [Anaerolineaceae bacterium]|nr:YraN family protein [Anaerolineaceae bacterium]
MGEQLAVNFLKEAGIEIVARNFRNDYGEVDIIGLDKSDMVFFEVKTRCTDAFGYPELAITDRKLSRMINSAMDYIQAFEQTVDWRIDVIAINLNKEKKTSQIEWIKNVTE